MAKTKFVIMKMDYTGCHPVFIVKTRRYAMKYSYRRNRNLRQMNAPSFEYFYFKEIKESTSKNDR